MAQGVVRRRIHASYRHSPDDVERDTARHRPSCPDAYAAVVDALQLQRGVPVRASNSTILRPAIFKHTSDTSETKETSETGETKETSFSTGRS